MYLQKVIGKKTLEKIRFCCCVKVTDEKSRIPSRIRTRIRYSQLQIRGAGSVPKCHGSGALDKIIKSLHQKFEICRRNVYVTHRMYLKNFIENALAGWFLAFLIGEFS
jgi:hypothetical protein